LASYVAVPVAAAAFALPATVRAADDYFLELSGIKGESVDKQFKDAIDVQSFSWGVQNSGKPHFQDLAIAKSVDAASPQLLLRAASGDPIATAKLTVRKAGPSPAPYLTLCLTDARVTSLSTAGSSGGDRPTESVTFSYSTIVESYRRQNADGSLAPPIVGGWNLIRNLQYGTSC
jgi:type VI secretion system secreted protein Hcp